MSLIRFARLSLIVVTSILPAAFRDAALQTPAQSPAPVSLAEQKLETGPA